jgi:hypothetical protein
MAKLIINEQAILELKAKMHKGLEDTGYIMGRKFTQEITDPKWDWPNPPSPRDIVDTGRLRASLQYISNQSNNTLKLSYPVDYAGVVHEGGVYKNGGTMTARPWIRTSLQQLDIEEIYKLVTQI